MLLVTKNPLSLFGKVKTPGASGDLTKAVYYSQKKAWMTGDIVLTAFNNKLRVQKRSVLLLLDNAGCHPEDIEGKFSNIKIVFLPANTTSKLQPLDLGIICHFKSHYRRLLLRYVITKIDSTSCASEVVKCIDVLTAIRWVALAWKEVKPSTIVKCFKHAGVLNAHAEVSSLHLSAEDPFQDIDENLQLDQLISAAMVTADSCSPEEFINGDEGLAICVEVDDATWEADFMDNLGSVQDAAEEEGESDNEDLTPPPPKI